MILDMILRCGAVIGGYNLRWNCLCRTGDHSWPGKGTREMSHQGINGMRKIEMNNAM